MWLIFGGCSVFVVGSILDVCLIFDVWFRHEARLIFDVCFL